MLKIRVPATTSNLSVGFDSIGLALNLYNEFHFEVAEKFTLIGFDSSHNEDNLVVKAYNLFCNENKISEQYSVKVRITLAEQEVPVAKGLGSSATCIIAGIVAANYFNRLDKTVEECANFASRLEGHPDNVFSAIYGGLNSSYLSHGEYINEVFEISKKFQFAVLIPDAVGHTDELRDALPEMVPLKDAVFHLSRMIHVPKAFSTGDFYGLRSLLQDKLHESYRSKSIPLFEFVKTLAINNQFICCVSGSGPSLFLISVNDNYKIFEKIESMYQLVPVTVSGGMSVKVV